MYVQNEYKEGVIYSQENSNIYFKARFILNSQDEVIYNILKKITELLADKNVNIKIDYCKDKIIDNKPENLETPSSDCIENIDIIVPKYQYAIDNMIFTDKQIYGKDFNGVGRKYRLIWTDSNQKEHFVPLIGIDNFAADNPNGGYSYDSSTHQLIFEKVSSEDINYIMRRYS